MMPAPFMVWALRGAHVARPGDQPDTQVPQDRRSPIRLGWNPGAKPAVQSTTPHLLQTKER